MGRSTRRAAGTVALQAGCYVPTGRVAFRLASQAVGKTGCYIGWVRRVARLMLEPAFVRVCLAAKERIRKMEYRCVEETDENSQALLEIYRLSYWKRRITISTLIVPVRRHDATVMAEKGELIYLRSDAGTRTTSGCWGCSRRAARGRAVGGEKVSNAHRRESGRDAGSGWRHISGEGDCGSAIKQPRAQQRSGRDTLRNKRLICCCWTGAEGGFVQRASPREVVRARDVAMHITAMSRCWRSPCRVRFCRAALISRVASQPQRPQPRRSAHEPPETPATRRSRHRRCPSSRIASASSCRLPPGPIMQPRRIMPKPMSPRPQSR